MRYLLDTNIWIFYLKNLSSPVGVRLRKTYVHEIAVCSVVRAELLERTLSPFTSLPFDDAAAGHYAIIRDDLESRGVTIGPNDLMIAAIAAAHQLTLVSNNREFNRVGGIRVEDWTIE